MDAQYKVIDPVKFYRDHLAHKIRPDGRGLLKFRPAVINVDSIGTADGSAIVKIGNTTVVCGVKLELGVPKPEESNIGWLVPNVTLPPLCSPRFHPGPPSDEAQVASNMLAEILSNASVLDLRALCVVPERLAWAVYLDAVCLNHDGSILDACVVAAVAALRTVRLPRVEHDADKDITKVFPDERSSLPITGAPIPTTHAIFEDEVILVDPTSDEESLASGLVTITVQNDQMCSVYKPGGSPLADENMQACLSRARTRAIQMNNLIEAALAARDKEETKDQKLIS
ncbi:hypothetical protein R5R35_000084 [Gryllus longicercus]|uniref:Ribosomal RNA-processing protein 43 n=1 Tax=Gryllus longicercus TaxID=2509291 RepID=A0AAN9VFL2_9ORTH